MMRCGALRYLAHLALRCGAVRQTRRTAPQRSASGVNEP